ncbi:hypothetical protein ACLD9W_11855 [Neisseria sp. WLZKY-1]|uniref:hypothetical protein n=1 Tax=Neisseria sp. WLZKY-1 TaxID=3390377 RepID=UPI00397DCB85
METSAGFLAQPVTVGNIVKQHGKIQGKQIADNKDILGNFLIIYNILLNHPL